MTQLQCVCGLLSCCGVPGNATTKQDHCKGRPPHCTFHMNLEQIATTIQSTLSASAQEREAAERQLTEVRIWNPDIEPRMPFTPHSVASCAQLCNCSHPTHDNGESPCFHQTRSVDSLQVFGGTVLDREARSANTLHPRQRAYKTQLCGTTHPCSAVCKVPQVSAFMLGLIHKIQSSTCSGNAHYFGERISS
jgi:hypothetical protein